MQEVSHHTLRGNVPQTLVLCRPLGSLVSLREENLVSDPNLEASSQYGWGEAQLRTFLASPRVTVMIWVWELHTKPPQMAAKKTPDTQCFLWNACVHACSMSVCRSACIVCARVHMAVTQRHARLFGECLHPGDHRLHARHLL